MTERNCALERTIYFSISQWGCGPQNGRVVALPTQIMVVDPAYADAHLQT